MGLFRKGDTKREVLAAERRAKSAEALWATADVLQAESQMIVQEVERMPDSSGLTDFWKETALTLDNAAVLLRRRAQMKQALAKAD